MKCSECNFYWKDKYESFPSCKADPNWPAPCEYENEDDDYEEEYTLTDLGNNWWQEER